ncbi:DUF1649-domain-containing protein [Heliocybe sulcata]|uniref:Autophagy-related protein 101 n=1 Tax=Heliocybe sulcata TaxID=5364 RepID=A0A5C3NG45_9AGAM|nr:DUF1649-domain-containing protein [Heliocybe sulcata]
MQTVNIDLVLDRRSTTEVLAAILHAVLFHRLFGTVKPATFEIQDITVPGVDDAEMKQLVTEKVNAFWRAIEVSPTKRGQIVITFSEKRVRKGWFSLGGEEEVPWEQWLITTTLRQPPPPISDTLTNALKTMLDYSASEKARNAVPLITNSNGISPFPFRIVVRVDGVEVG